MPTLNLEPEPIEALRARYPAALVTVWDAEGIAFGDKDFVDRPGLHREHVFDFRDGGEICRLIVSVERLEHPPETFLHVSQSVNAPIRMLAAEAIEKALRQWAAIAQPPKPVRPNEILVESWGFTTKVVHLILPWPQEAP